jgi:hypothetical protein
MARIAHGPAGSAPQIAAAGAIAGDDYLAKVVKLIPAEVVATYTAIFNLVDTLPKPWHTTSYWINVIFFWIATPVVLLLIARKKEGCQVWRI